MAGVVARLARARLINTFPGRDGALILPRRASQITLKDVVETSEGPILLSQCLQVKGENDRPLQPNCPVRPKGRRVQVAIMCEMASIIFEDLTQGSHGIPRVMPGFV
jgi:Rrf2 family transcriptional regulator, iron-responsive regulator